MVPNKQIIGTKLAPNRELIASTGIPSLDYVIGGGMQVGSIFLIEEDTSGCYAKTMLKYFLSEGVVMGHEILIASMDNDPQQFISDLPAATNVDSSSSSSTQQNIEDDIKIAWRYKHMSPVETVIETKSQFGHYFDLGSKMDSDTLKKASIAMFQPHDNSSQQSKSTKYDDLLQYIRSEIQAKTSTNEQSNKKNNLLRIGIESLGSPFWCSHGDGLDNLKHEGRALQKFLKLLKILLNTVSAVVFVTIPCHILQYEGTVHHLRFLVDTSVKLDSFAGTPRENNPALKDYHGLFYVTKFSALKSIVGIEARMFDLAFKLRRKKFVIEKLHLPPELQESAEREQDDTSCGSSRQIAVDF